MENIFNINHPNIDKINIDEEDVAKFSAELKKANSPKYLSWKELKYRSWIPEKFLHNKEEFWALLKFFRKSLSNNSPIKDEKNFNFSWFMLSDYNRLLHEIDLDMSKYLFDFSKLNNIDYDAYQIKGLVEEAIASSQLEGAHTTRKVAKSMIEEKRPPKTKGEKMIFDNYVAIKSIQEKFKDEKMSLDLLFELHKMLTKNSDDLEENEKGVFRTISDEIVVGDAGNSDITYITPPIEFVKKEIKNLIAFANDELEGDSFIHPVIKAIMLHFWIGFLHPFVDGNGRLARCIFYWYLLRKGYWAFAFLPISIVIKNSPKQYSDAYVLSEQDGNDLNYFIDYHIAKIEHSIENFRLYMAKQIEEKNEIKKMLKEQKELKLNIRQAELIQKLHKNPDTVLTMTSYMNINNISKVSALKDLQKLVTLGYLSREKQGKNVFYHLIKKK